MLIEAWDRTALSDQEQTIGRRKSSDPAAFVALQTRLGSRDALNEYVKHVGSAVFAVPGGTAGAGGVLAPGLFA